MQRRRRASCLRLAADIGGTFTDVAVFDDRSGRLAFGKVLSTPDHLAGGIAEGVAKAGVGYACAELFVHGSTVAINTILERKGARTALLGETMPAPEGRDRRPIDLVGASWAGVKPRPR
ncbi:MAG TPA: hydantoinase/oxoprolinase N-terminal domain-containing protein [Xanthobacteraceae bacterium]|jgi:N-methylhydantoinase A